MYDVEFLTWQNTISMFLMLSKQRVYWRFLRLCIEHESKDNFGLLASRMIVGQFAKRRHCSSNFGMITTLQHNIGFGVSGEGEFNTFFLKRKKLTMLVRGFGVSLLQNWLWEYLAGRRKKGFPRELLGRFYRGGMQF